MRRQLGMGDKDRASITRRRSVRPLAAQIGGLACSRFQPRQQGMIFIRAAEVDHSLASHLVGPDPLACDQLIGLSPSEFAIALNSTEPAPLVVVIVNYGFLHVLR